MEEFWQAMYKCDMGTKAYLRGLESRGECHAQYSAAWLRKRFPVNYMGYESSFDILLHNTFLFLRKQCEFVASISPHIPFFSHVFLSVGSILLLNSLYFFK